MRDAFHSLSKGSEVSDEIILSSISSRQIWRRRDACCYAGHYIINRPWSDSASPYPSVSQLFSSQKIAIMVSFGIAEYQGHDRKLLLLAADKALYAAKNAGRSRIFVSIGSQLIADVAVLHMHTLNYALRHPCGHNS